MRGLQGVESFLRAKARGEAIVVIYAAVVVPRGGKVDQAGEVAGNAGQGATEKVVVCIIPGYELGSFAHLGSVSRTLCRYRLNWGRSECHRATEPVIKIARIRGEVSQGVRADQFNQER